jgi:hypothetical protein
MFQQGVWLPFRWMVLDWLLPLPAGGGWEGVTLLSPKPKAPLPNPPLRAGEGAFSSPFEARGQPAPV